MSITEAGCAPKLILRVDVEMSSLAPVAPLPFHVLLAVAVASGVVAAGSVLQAALGQATASLAAERAKVPVVDLALNKISSF